jgi:hypothetical protein
VDLMKSWIPSTGLAPWTKTLPLPIRSHPCEASAASWSREPLLAACSFLFSWRQFRRVHSPPGTNLIWYSNHWDTRGKVCTYVAKDHNSANSSSSESQSLLYTATTMSSDCAQMVAGMSMC